jgi:hypothetical protein
VHFCLPAIRHVTWLGHSLKRRLDGSIIREVSSSSDGGKFEGIQGFFFDARHSHGFENTLFQIPRFSAFAWADASLMTSHLHLR